MYNKAMKEMFKKIPLTIIKYLNPKKNPETYDRNGCWVVNSNSSKGLPSLKIKNDQKITR